MPYHREGQAASAACPSAHRRSKCQRQTNSSKSASVSNGALIHRSGAVRPAGGVATFGRDGELHSPNPLRTRRKGTSALRLFLPSGSTNVDAKLTFTLET